MFYLSGRNSLICGEGKLKNDFKKMTYFCLFVNVNDFLIRKLKRK